MDVKERIMVCRLLEKMETNIQYGQRLGLENASTLCGVNIIQRKNEEKKI